MRLSSSAPGRCSGSDAVDFALASRRAIGEFVCVRRPIHEPTSAATNHQAAMTSTSTSPVCVRPDDSTVTAASAVAEPPHRSTAERRKSTNRTSLQEAGR